MKGIEKDMRVKQRKLADLEKEVAQRIQEENRLKAENAALEHRIKSVTHNYRSKLLEYLNEQSTIDGLGEDQRKAMMADLTQNYQRIEEKNQRGHRRASQEKL